MTSRKLPTMAYSSGDMAPPLREGRGIFLQPKPVVNWKNRKTELRNKKIRCQTRNAFQNIDMYEPPRLTELRRQNRLKTKRFFYLKRRAPQAPRNTTSFILQSKRAGGIASLVSPIPATPAILTTPAMSPAPRYRERLVDEVNKEWGVNGYGSMNGIIRLRKQGELVKGDFESDTDMDRDPESVQQLEQRLDQDLSRFEMIYPSSSVRQDPRTLVGHDPRTFVETVLEDQEDHIAHLEEENLTLKERLYLMGQELEELRRRVQRNEKGGVSDEQAEIFSDQSVGDVSCAKH